MKVGDINNFIGIKKIERVKDEVSQLVGKKCKEFGVLIHKIWESITLEYQYM
jgi:hypothetical protein